MALLIAARESSRPEYQVARTVYGCRAILYHENAAANKAEMRALCGGLLFARRKWDVSEAAYGETDEG